MVKKMLKRMLNLFWMGLRIGRKGIDVFETHPCLLHTGTGLLAGKNLSFQVVRRERQYVWSKYMGRKTGIWIITLVAINLLFLKVSAEAEEIEGQMLKIKKLIPNSSFEQVIKRDAGEAEIKSLLLAGWKFDPANYPWRWCLDAAAPGTLKVINGIAHTGTRCVQLGGNGVLWNPYGEVKKDASYRIRIWAKGKGTITLRGNLFNVTNDQGRWIGGVNILSDATLTENWQEYSGVYKVDDPNITIINPGVTASGPECYLDDFDFAETEIDTEPSQEEAEKKVSAEAEETEGQMLKIKKLIPNSSFEQVIKRDAGEAEIKSLLLAGWKFDPTNYPWRWYLDAAAPGTLEVINGIAHTGTRCVQLGGNGALYYSSGEVKKDASYRIRIWAKGKGMITLFGYLYGVQNEGEQIHWLGRADILRDVTLTENWREYSGVYKVEDPNISGIAPGVMASGPECYLDDFDFAEMEIDTEPSQEKAEKEEEGKKP